MQQEIEVKFLNVPHDGVRTRLKAAGATCTHPMRLMRRSIIDYPDKRLQTSTPNGWSWVRVRDEGDRIMCAYKHIGDGEQYTIHEIEFEVPSYEKAVALFTAIGLVVCAEQESKRETWQLDDVEVVLDEWPWLPPYIELEGPSEQALQAAAQKLGYDWNDVFRGSGDDAYRVHYPKITDKESISDMPQLTFADMPQYLKDRA